MSSGASTAAVETSVGAADYYRKIERSRAALALVLPVQLSDEERAQNIREFQEEREAIARAHGIAQGKTEFSSFLSQAKSFKGKETQPVVLPPGVKITKVEKKRGRKAAESAVKAEKIAPVASVFDLKDLKPGTMRVIDPNSRLDLGSLVSDSSGRKGKIVAYSEVSYHICQVMWENETYVWLDERKLSLVARVVSVSQIKAAAIVGREDFGRDESLVYQIGEYKVNSKQEKDPKTKEPIVSDMIPSSWGDAHCCIAWKDDKLIQFDPPQGHEKSLEFWENEIGAALKYGRIDSVKLIIPEQHKTDYLTPGHIYSYVVKLKDSFQCDSKGMILPRSGWVGSKGQVKNDKYDPAKKEWINLKEESTNFELTISYQGGHDSKVIFASSASQAVRMGIKIMTEENRGCYGAGEVSHGWIPSQVKIQQLNLEIDPMVDPLTGKLTARLTLDMHKVSKLVRGSIESTIEATGQTIKALDRDPWKDPRKKQFMMGAPGRAGITFTKTDEQIKEDKRRSELNKIERRVVKADVKEKMAEIKTSAKDASKRAKEAFYQG